MSQIVAVASGKGGVGKTWLAVTLAHALARRGRRVLLLDGDLGLANVDVQLGLGNGPDLGQVVAGRMRLRAAVHHFESAGFDLVPGRSGSGSLAALATEQVERLIGEILDLAPDYDHVVLDLAAGVDRMLLRLAAAADRALVVTTDEPTALTDAYAFVKLHRRDTDSMPEAVINMARSRAAGEETHATLSRVCRSFLQRPLALAGIVRHDSRVADSIRRQTPHLIRHPGSPAALDVEGLAAWLAR
jgi:flagellar biosynthesis protein FlhG